jgi:hypothetical protein
MSSRRWHASRRCAPTPTPHSRLVRFAWDQANHSSTFNVIAGLAFWQPGSGEDFKRQVEDFSVRAKAKSCDISVITPALAPRGDKVLRGGPSILLTDHRKMRRGTLHGDKGWAEHVSSARVFQTSTCSAMARASSTSMPRYLTVLLILVGPSSHDS